MLNLVVASTECYGHGRRSVGRQGEMPPTFRSRGDALCCVPLLFFFGGGVDGSLFAVSCRETLRFTLLSRRRTAGYAEM